MSRTLFLLLVSGALMACVSCRQRHTFTPSDPAVQKFITAIEAYEAQTGGSPTSLEQLVPEYLDSLEKPKDIEEVRFELDRTTSEWRLIFAGQLNAEFIYESSTQNWRAIPPHP